MVVTITETYSYADHIFPNKKVDSQAGVGGTAVAGKTSLRKKQLRRNLKGELRINQVKR